MTATGQTDRQTDRRTDRRNGMPNAVSESDGCTMACMTAVTYVLLARQESDELNWTELNV